MSASQRLGLVKFRETSPADIVQKLRRELQRIEGTEDPVVAIDHIMNAFRTAWRVHEWIWSAIEGKPELRHAVLSYRGIQGFCVANAEAFGSLLASRFVPLNLCRMIATSTRFVRLEPARALADGSQPPQDGPMIVVLGRPIPAIRLLVEVDDYWVTMILDCGLGEQ